MATVNLFPYDITDLDEKTSDQLSEHFSGKPDKLVQVGPEKMLILAQFRHEMEEYYTFKIKESDIFVAGFPRSGTSLIKDIVWFVLTQTLPATAAPSFADIPLLESKSVTSERTVSELNSKSLAGCASTKLFTSSLKHLSKMTGRRVIRTHLHFNCLPPELTSSGCKVIYIARNPKEVILSMYYMYCDRRNFTGSFPSFVELFMSGLVLYTPYWAHLSLAWSHKDFQNFLFLFYEDVIQDLDEHIKGIAQFIETEVSNEQIELLKGKLMSQERVLETSRKFIGEKLEVDDEFNVEGLEEDWREFYTEKMNDRVDEWITVNLEKIGAMIGI